MKTKIVFFVIAALFMSCNNPSSLNSKNIAPTGNWKETYSNLMVYGINDSLVLNKAIYADTNKLVKMYMQINDTNVIQYGVMDSCYYLKSGTCSFENGIISLSIIWNLPSSFERGVYENGKGSYNTADSIFLYDTVSYDNTSVYYVFGYRKSYSIVKFAKISSDLPNSNWPNKLCN